MSAFKCDHEGCPNGIETGHALHRVSPKPGPFAGLCDEHYAGEPDPVARAIQQAGVTPRTPRPEGV